MQGGYVKAIKQYYQNTQLTHGDLLRFRQLLYFILNHVLVGLFMLSLGRMIFFLYFLPEYMLAETSGLEILKIFGLSMRFDVSSQCILWVFPFLLVSLQAWRGRMAEKSFTIWQKTLNVWAFGVMLMTVSLLVTSHYYYFYYKDHFNIFFWEFWLNLENSALVVGGMFDELPMPEVMLYWVLMMGFWLLCQRFTWKVWHALSFPRSSNFRVSLLLIVIMFSIGVRGTVGRPLPVQRLDGLVSSQPFLNLTHANPFYNLYFSWTETVENVERLKKIFAEKSTAQEVEQNLKKFADLEPARKIIQNERGENRLNYQVPLLGSQFLKRPPKHIVIFFLESYSSWPSAWAEEDFNQLIMPTFLSLKAEGINFDQYFQAGSGTISNIAKATLGTSNPHNFPLEVSFKEAYLPFPHGLAPIFKVIGYQPNFFYGGSLGWHRLYYLLPKWGYENVFGENNSGTQRKSYFGLYDEDLFALVDDYLQHSKSPTLSFVMSLSNHPPYNVPPDYQPKRELSIPPNLLPLVKDKKYFLKRFNGFAYTDYALGEYFRKARQSSYFKDTLYVITADHVMNRRIKFKTKDRYRMEKIPLLFYAPDLLVQTPTTISTRGTHLDLIPTLLSLVAHEEMNIHSWGKSLLAEAAQDDLFSFRLNCLNEICLYKGRVMRLDGEQNMISCKNLTCWSTAEHIYLRRRAFDISGTDYFFNEHR